jgi:hypothetical protein
VIDIWGYLEQSHVSILSASEGITRA